MRGRRKVEARDGFLYPWAKWFKQKQWNLVKGKHFDVEPHSMAMQVRNAATRYGYKVSVSILKKGLKVRVV